MKDRKIFVFWRQPYELIAGFVWITSSAVAALYGYYGDFGMRFLLLAAIPMLLIGIYRLLQAFSLQNFKARLQSIPDLQMSLDTLIRLQKAHPKKTYVGHGFTWTQRHTQIYADYKARDKNLSHPGDQYMWWRRLFGFTSKYFANVPMHLHGIGHKEEKPLYTNLEKRQQHQVYSGTTGSGKGRKATVDLVGALVREEPVIYLDPKVDRTTINVIYATLKRQKRAHYLYYFNPNEPQSSVRLDLLNSYGSLSQVATRVTNMIPPSKNEEFKMFAWRAVFNIVQALTLMGEKLSLVKIRECIQHDMSYLVQRAGAHYFAKYKETADIARKVEDEPDRKKAADMVVTVYNSILSKKYPSKEMESLFGLYGQDQKHYQKLIQTIIPILVQLTSGVFKELLSPDPANDDPRPIINLKTVARTHGVLYLNLATLSDPETGASLGSFLLNDSINLVADRYYYNNEVLDDAVLNFFIDEASDVFNRSAISLLNKSRGSKAAITVMLQSAVKDIEYRMGDAAAAEVALGNLNTKVQMRATDVPTPEYMSAQCGETTIAQIDYDHRTQSTASQSLDFNTSYAKTVSHTEVPLVPPEAFLDLPNLHFFIIGDSDGVQKVRVPYISVPEEDSFKEPPFTDSPFGLLPGFSELIDVKTNHEHIPFEVAENSA